MGTGLTTTLNTLCPISQEHCSLDIDNNSDCSIYPHRKLEGIKIIEAIPNPIETLEEIMNLACPFCNPNEIILSNDLAYAIYDRYPVNEGHMLIIPYRHVEDFWISTPEERRALNDLIEECKELLDNKFKPNGYNIGINCGEAAGQTVFHLHVHLIPRYSGDIDNPRGGVRGVIPSRRIY